MIATKTLITATVLLLATPIVPALAHDDDDYGYNRHWQLHDELSAAHERAHEEGFESGQSTAPTTVHSGICTMTFTKINWVSPTATTMRGRAFACTGGCGDIRVC